MDELGRQPVLHAGVRRRASRRGGGRRARARRGGPRVARAGGRGDALVHPGRRDRRPAARPLGDARRRRPPTPARKRAQALPGTLIRDFYEPLWSDGLALRNQGDIDTQQIAGAVSTATHGSGTRYTSLSGVVRGVRLVTGERRDPRDRGGRARPAPRRPGRRRDARRHDPPRARGDRRVPPARAGRPAVLGRRHGAAGTSSSPSTATSASSGCPPRSPPRSTTSTASRARPLTDQCYVKLFDEVGARRPRRRHARPPGRPLLPHLPDGLRPELPRARVLRRAREGPGRAARDARAHAARACPTRSIRSRSGPSAPTTRSSRPSTRRATTVISVSGKPGTDYWDYLRSVDALLADFDARVHWGKLHFLTPERLHALYPRADDFIAHPPRARPGRASSSTTTCGPCSGDARGRLPRRPRDVAAAPPECG